MIHENIREARRKSGLSQTEVADQCHVVRQTVAKWESGRSLPDAQTLTLLAEVLVTPVTQLLGIVDGEAAELRCQLETLQQKQELADKANRARGMILLLCFAALLIALRAGESIGTMLLVSGCLLGSLAVLWHHMAALTCVVTPQADLKPIRIATIASATVIACLALFAALIQMEILAVSEKVSMALVTLLIAGMMVFFGWLGPKLPFNRHTGLRLPWTVADADTWYLAHRIMGWISLPVAMLYVAAVCVFPAPDMVTLAAMAVYIGIPGGISFRFYWRKLKGK